MSNWLISIISVIIGVVLGGIISRKVSLDIIEKQEAISAKREFRKTINNLIVRIKYNDFAGEGKLWRNLRDYCSIIDEAIRNVSPHLDRTTIAKINAAYNYYKQPYVDDGTTFEPFRVYSFDEETAKKINGYEFKNGEEFAIANLNNILNLVK